MAAFMTVLKSSIQSLDSTGAKKDSARKVSGEQVLGLRKITPNPL
jgi:hypothetical protein